MNNSSEHKPFAKLGDILKSLREKQRESLAEAAGAVEIGEEELQQIEQGKNRPSEEILLLLITHFGITEDDAVRIWEMAGYDAEDNQSDDTESQGTKTIVMAIALDPRIMYSDHVQVDGSKHGIILNFMQPGAGNIPPMPVSRIGMSREQAEKLADLLKETIRQLDDMHKPKQLPGPSPEETEAS